MAANPEFINKAIVNFNLDGEDVEAFEGETILQVAQRHGKEIPHLCYTENLRPDGNCRACVVEVEGERVLAPSCWLSRTSRVVLCMGRIRVVSGVGLFYLAVSA